MSSQSHTTDGFSLIFSKLLPASSLSVTHSSSTVFNSFPHCLLYPHLSIYTRNYCTCLNVWKLSSNTKWWRSRLSIAFEMYLFNLIRSNSDNHQWKSLNYFSCLNHTFLITACLRSVASQKRGTMVLGILSVLIVQYCRVKYNNSRVLYSLLLLYPLL